MSKEESIAPGYFAAAYIIVKTLAIYGGVFLLCFYWPQFLSSLTLGHGDPRSALVAGVLITPLGFLILGAAYSKWHAAAHAILIGIGAGAAWVGITQLGAPGDDPLQKLIAVWTPVIILIYVAGFAVSCRRELRAS